jgi:hypothetical protein
MTEEVERIVAGLTKAQRAWLINPGYVDPNTLRALRRKGVIATGHRGLTETGTAVRAHLIAQQEGSGESYHQQEESQ